MKTAAASALSFVPDGLVLVIPFRSDNGQGAGVHVYNSGEEIPEEARGVYENGKAYLLKNKQAKAFPCGTQENPRILTVHNVDGIGHRRLD